MLIRLVEKFLAAYATWVLKMYGHVEYGYLPRRGMNIPQHIPFVLEIFYSLFIGV